MLAALVSVDEVLNDSSAGHPSSQQVLPLSTALPLISCASTTANSHPPSDTVTGSGSGRGAATTAFSTAEAGMAPVPAGALDGGAVEGGGVAGVAGSSSEGDGGISSAVDPGRATAAARSNAERREAGSGAQPLTLATSGLEGRTGRVIADGAARGQMGRRVGGESSGGVGGWERVEGEEGEDDEMSGVSRQSLGGLEEALEQYRLSTPPPDRGPGRMEREEEGSTLGGGGAGVDGVGDAAGLVRVLGSGMDRDERAVSTVKSEEGVDWTVGSAHERGRVRGRGGVGGQGRASSPWAERGEPQEVVSDGGGRVEGTRGDKHRGGWLSDGSPLYGWQSAVEWEEREGGGGMGSGEEAEAGRGEREATWAGNMPEDRDLSEFDVAAHVSAVHAPQVLNVEMVQDG